MKQYFNVFHLTLVLVNTPLEHPDATVDPVSMDTVDPVSTDTVDPGCAEPGNDTQPEGEEERRGQTDQSTIEIFPEQAEKILEVLSAFPSFKRPETLPGEIHKTSNT